MPTTKQQAARAALKAPRYSTEHALTDLGLLVPALESATREAASQRAALQLGEMESTDPMVRQLYEPVYQKLATIERLSTEIRDRMRDLVRAFRERDKAAADLESGVQSQAEATTVHVPPSPPARTPRAARPTVVRSKPERVDR